MSSDDASYRADIDGLRAIAVLAVVLYHFDVGPFRGGFIGVDIFFVISGFLITGILDREVAAGSFSFRAFYHRRARRLLPALFATLVATLAVAFVAVLPSDLLLLAKTVIATVLFSSNVMLWRTSGYFDGDAEVNPLLHTWSLAVEEQFYVGFPLLLIVLYRYLRGHLRHVIVGGALVSFAACVGLQRFLPAATFYLSPFRAWELALGSLLALGAIPPLRQRWMREGAFVLGLLAIVAGTVNIEAGADFPGWRAAIPVFATGLVIHAGSGGEYWCRRIVRTPALVHVGLISYSLYLVHWPVVTLLRTSSASELTAVWRWGGLLASFVLAAASHRFVETPFRRAHGQQNPRAFLLRVGLFQGVLLLACVGIYYGGGMKRRFDARTVALDAERHPRIPYLQCCDGAISTQSSCRLGTKQTEPTILFWGDSHSVAWAPAVDTMLRGKGLAAWFVATSACPPLADVNTDANQECLGRNAETLRLLNSQVHITDVLVVASWRKYAGDFGRYRLSDAGGGVGNVPIFRRTLQKTLSLLRQGGRSVWLIGPTPGAPGDIPRKMALASQHGWPDPAPISRAEFTRSAASFRRALSSVGDNEGLHFVDPTDWLCGPIDCRYATDGLPLYRDDGHLNIRGATELQKPLAAAFSALKARNEVSGRQ